MEMAAGPMEKEETTKLIIGSAQEFWVQQFGAARRKRGDRWDKGCKKPQAQGAVGNSRVGWLRQRRQALSNAVQTAASQRQQNESNSSCDGDSPVRAEHDRQKDQLLKRRLDALSQGHLIDEEIDEPLLAHAKKAKKEQDKKDRRAVNAKTLLEKKMVPEPLTTLQGKRIFRDGGCDLASLSQRVLRAAGAVVVDSACDAGVVMAAKSETRSRRRAVGVHVERVPCHHAILLGR